MKLISIFLLSSLLAFNTAQARQGDTPAISRAAMSLAEVYVSYMYPSMILAVPATLLISVMTMPQTKEVQYQVRNAINSDAQNYYQNGVQTAPLMQIIKNVKTENENLSDDEAVDLILSIVNQ
jgi:hypothetical protein